MPRSRIERIREKIRQRRYDMTVHAMDEMAEDDLNIEDVEAAVLSGKLARIERDNRRGSRYVIEGWCKNRTIPVGVVGRFTSSERYLIITVYEITSLYD